MAKQLIQTMRPNLSFMFIGDPLGAIISKFGLNSPENGKTPMTNFGKLYSHRVVINKYRSGSAKRKNVLNYKQRISPFVFGLNVTL